MTRTQLGKQAAFFQPHPKHCPLCLRKAQQLDTPSGERVYGSVTSHKPFTACLHATVTGMNHGWQAALRVNSYSTIQTGLTVILKIKEAFFDRIFRHFGHELNLMTLQSVCVSVTDTFANTLSSSCWPCKHYAVWLAVSHKSALWESL